MLRWVAASFCLDKVLLVNVLLVAPSHLDLPLIANEVKVVGKLLDPRTSLDDIVTEDILDAAIRDHVNEGGDYDGVWISTHMSTTEVQLTVGHTLDIAALVEYIKRTGAKWCVLNGCESAGLAYDIAAIGVDVVAVAITEGGTGIGDREALRMGTALAERLAANDGDLEAAFSSIPNAGTTYRYFPAGAAASRAFTDGDRDIYKLIYEVRTELAKLTARVDGVERHLDNIDDRLDGLANRPKTTPTMTILMGLAIGGLFIAIVAVMIFMSGRGL